MAMGSVLKVRALLWCLHGVWCVPSISACRAELGLAIPVVRARACAREEKSCACALVVAQEESSCRNFVVCDLPQERQKRAVVADLGLDCLILSAPSPRLWPGQTGGSQWGESGGSHAGCARGCHGGRRWLETAGDGRRVASNGYPATAVAAMATCAAAIVVTVPDLRTLWRR
jgi:hypothetical protein